VEWCLVKILMTYLEGKYLDTLVKLQLLSWFFPKHLYFCRETIWISGCFRISPELIEKIYQSKLRKKEAFKLRAEIQVEFVNHFQTTKNSFKTAVFVKFSNYMICFKMLVSLGCRIISRRMVFCRD
jgi:hypothetical protein